MQDATHYILDSVNWITMAQESELRTPKWKNVIHFWIPGNDVRIFEKGCRGWKGDSICFKSSLFQFLNSCESVWDKKRFIMTSKPWREKDGWVLSSFQECNLWENSKKNIEDWMFWLDTFFRKTWKNWGVVQQLLGVTTSMLKILVGEAKKSLKHSFSHSSFSSKRITRDQWKVASKTSFK